jgi:hypothetical protein
MNKIDFEGMSQIANDGQMIWVENALTHLPGRVVGCECEMIHVDVGDRVEAWNHSDCVELTYGYRVKYDVVMNYPHEFDTHLD